MVDTVCAGHHEGPWSRAQAQAAEDRERSMKDGLKSYYNALLAAGHASHPTIREAQRDLERDQVVRVSGGLFGF